MCLHPGYYTADQEVLEIAREFLDSVETSLSRIRVADDCAEQVPEARLRR